MSGFITIQAPSGKEPSKLIFHGVAHACRIVDDIGSVEDIKTEPLQTVVDDTLPTG